MERETEMETESEPIPYWVWACDANGEQAVRRVRDGELFFVLLDRLEHRGVKAEGVDASLREAADAMAVVHRQSGERLRELAVRFGSRAGGRDYERIRELSKEWLERVRLASARVQAGQLNPEPLDRALARLRASVREANDVFKEAILRSYVSFFQGDYFEQPANVGYMLDCVRLIENVLDRLSPQMEEADGSPLAQPMPAHEALQYLLDWDGDYASLSYQYWRRELNGIAGC